MRIFLKTGRGAIWMHNLITRIVLWLCSRYHINPIDTARLANGRDAVERGARWEAFYRETGGLADMMRDIRLGYFEASAALSPRDTDKIYEYALADRIARELQRKIEAVIVTGKVEADRAETIERMNIARIRR